MKIVAGIMLATAQAAATPAGAAAGIRPGKWEYTVTTQMPNLPQLPPGVQLPPNVQVPAGGGMTATHTSRVTSTDPAAELAKPHGPAAAQSRCNVDRMDRSGSTVSWATSCIAPDGMSRSEGAKRYSGERVKANSRTRTTPRNGTPLEVSNHIVAATWAHATADRVFVRGASEPASRRRESSRAMPRRVVPSPTDR